MNEKNRFENRKQPEPKIITVDQEEGWKITKAPNIIEATGLGPCVGVIVYDPESKQAMVGHFIDPVANNLQGMLDEAVKRFPNISKLKIYVGGGAPEPDDAPHFTDDRAKRAFVKKQLEDHEFLNSQITTNYHNSNDATTMRIDTSTGNVEYNEESYWDDKYDEDDYKSNNNKYDEENHLDDEDDYNH